MDIRFPEKPTFGVYFRLVLLAIFGWPHTLFYRFWTYWHFGPSQRILQFNKNNAKRLGNFVVFGKFKKDLSSSSNK